MNAWNGISNFFAALFKVFSRKPKEVSEPQKPVQEIPAPPPEHETVPPSATIPPVEMPTSRPAEPPPPPPDTNSPHPYSSFSLEQMLDVMDQTFDLIGTKHIREDDGPNKDKAGWIVKFQKTVDGHADRESWCLAFQQFMYHAETAKELTAELVLTKKLTAEKEAAYLKFLHSFEKVLPKTEGCLDAWNKAPEWMKTPHTRPIRRAIGIYQHVGTWKGHAFSVRSIDPDGKKGFVKTDEGNTGPESTVNRDGDGEYVKLRRYDALSSTMMLKGFIVPWATQPQSVELGRMG